MKLFPLTDPIVYQLATMQKGDRFESMKAARDAIQQHVWP